MSIKGWKKVSELKYESLVRPGWGVLITKKHIHLASYNGWGVKQTTPYGSYVVVPDQGTFIRHSSNPNYTWIDRTKKEAIKAAMDWMRAHPAGA